MTVITKVRTDCTHEEMMTLEGFLHTRCGVRNAHARSRYLADLLDRWEAEREKFAGDIRGFMQSLIQKA